MKRRYELPPIDLAAARDVLALAILTIDPDEALERQQFVALMPELHALRQKGVSFEDLASLLNKAGCRFSSSTVRTYYYESVVATMETIGARIDEELALLAEAVLEASEDDAVVNIAPMKHEND